MSRIGITLGDPAGVGPEIVARALESRPLPPGHLAALIGSEAVLRSCAARSGAAISFAYDVVTTPEQVRASQRMCLLAVEDEGADAIVRGRPSPPAARMALAAIDRGLKLALDGSISALVTGPVSKQSIAELGVPFTGHTEYLAAGSGARHTVMMFVAEPRDEPPMRVSFVTTHLPMRKLPQAITTERVARVIRMTHDALRERFGVAQPKIAVAGLNPHAGEAGLFGREERDAIEPAILLARGKGISSSGPYSADTIFRRAREEGLDAVVAMYHDQALPLIKTMYPEAVNTTLGLPFVRTSPDHGPAYDKAGKGSAEWRPMAAAIHMAARLAR